MAEETPAAAEEVAAATAPAAEVETVQVCQIMQIDR